MYGYRACPECGAAVQQVLLEAEAHACAPERYAAHQTMIARRGLERLEEDLAWWLTTPAGKFQAFLAAAPEARRARELIARRFDPEELHLAGEGIYLHCPNGYGRAKLGNTFLERQLGVVATTRNWRTVTALAELANA